MNIAIFSARLCRRLSIRSPASLIFLAFPEQKEVGKEDYVIICGDFGGVWDVDRFMVQESPEEKNALDWLESKPFTTLVILGNHENYDRLIVCTNERLMDS